MGIELKSKMDDHSLDAVPEEDRKNWLNLTWNTAGIVTTLVILFFGALVCFVAGVKIALISGVIACVFGTLIGFGLSRIAVETGYSNTLITRQHGLGVKGSVLASIIFGFLIIGMLALENALLYRGVLFFFEMGDTVANRIAIYGVFTLVWILFTAFGFKLVARFSSVMLISFLLVLGWIMADVLFQSPLSLAEAVLFGSQLPDEALAAMGITSEWDKYVFAINILIGPACALPLVSVDYGRYAKSTAHATTAVAIGSFFQSVIVMIVGGVLMHAAADAMSAYFMNTQNLAAEEASQRVLNSPDSIAAVFMVFGGVVGFVLMIIAQSKAQVLNCYSASLCLSNLFDALFGWRPGRFTFVIFANVIALMMLYGHILELVEAWLSLLGVLLSSLAGVILVDYYLVKPWLEMRATVTHDAENINWAGVITILASIFSAHYLLNDIIKIEVISSCMVVLIGYPLLRLFVFKPASQSLASSLSS